MSTTISPTLVNDKDFSYLSDQELQAFKVNKAKWFKGTIAVCVVYGTFAILLLLVALFDSRGKEMLSDTFLPFTITFVGGMIVVIILLVIQVTTFKPKKIQNGIYDKDVCPDYWKATPSSADEIAHVQGADKYLMKIKCEMDSNVFHKKLGYDNTSNLNIMDDDDWNVFNTKIMKDGTYNSIPTTLSSNVFNRLGALSSTMYGSNAIPGTGIASLSNIRCDKLFPSLMAKEDHLHFANSPNTLRCEYAKACGISWSSVCP